MYNSQQVCSYGLLDSVCDNACKYSTQLAKAHSFELKYNENYTILEEAVNMHETNYIVIFLEAVLFTGSYLLIIYFLIGHNIHAEQVNISHISSWPGCMSKFNCLDSCEYGYQYF